jgi:hypothetical protein
MGDVASSANGFADGLSRAIGAHMGSELDFLGIAALVFAASDAATPYGADPCRR